MSDAGNGSEYFWMARRAMANYRWLSETEYEEILAETVFAAFVSQYPLSFSLFQWSVRRAIYIHCKNNNGYPHIAFHLVHNYPVFQPELKDDNIVSLVKFRSRMLTSSNMLA